jgi:PIN domain nuclease of toxin-antitoxin system
MKLLLDTHALLWFLDDDARLSASAKSTIEDPANDCFLSPGCLFEIALKVRLGKLTLRAPFAVMFPAELKAADIQLLPLDIRHIEPLTSLQLCHRDPFDRLFAATALVEGFTIVSKDLIFDAYGVARLW